MNKYKEYFIGGPLDGKYRQKEFPRTNEYVIRFDEVWTLDHFHNDQRAMDEVPDLLGEIKARWVYTRHTFVFGGIGFTYYADERLMSREMILARIAELILSAHINHLPDPCVCTDSVHSATGRCPTKNSGEYDMCPRRRLTEAEIVKQFKSNPPDANESEVPA